MQFDSPDYFVFLAAALAFYWAARKVRTVRLLGLFAFGLIFYGTLTEWEDGRGRLVRYVGLLVGAAVADYWAANRIARTDDERIRKRWLVASVLVNLGLLGTFKYWNFAASSIRAGAAHFGAEVPVPLHQLALPVGISFYTFESMSYTIDVYRRKLTPAKSLAEFVLFIGFFPKLIAGPIVRAADFLPQLEAEPRLRAQQVSDGIFLFALGLVKKVVFGNYVAVNLVDRVFDAPDRFTSAETVVALYGFTLQIFCDFSGYTDMARGSAKLFGIELSENFDRPYAATNIADFWRRWHMTLSTWLRDYLYYPLGGSKVGGARAYFNLFLTMFLIALWHGAKWTFVLYGVFQGLAMVLHRWSVRTRGPAKDDSTGMRLFKVFATMQFVVFTRILFRAEDFENARGITRTLLDGGVGLRNVAPTVWVVLAVGFAAHYTPKAWLERLRTAFAMQHPVLQGVIAAAVFAAVSRIATSQVVPFIYQVF